MYFLIFIAIICVVYVRAFKDNFTKENIDKVTPVLVIVCVISLLLSIFGNAL